MIRVILIGFVVVLLSGGLHAQIAPTTDVIQRTMSERLALVFEAAGKTQSTISLTVSDHPDAPWVESIALEQAIGSGLEVSTTTAPTDVQVVVKDLSTRYEAMGESDSVRRIITVDLEAIVSAASKKTVVGKGAVSDTLICTRRDAIAAESRQHRATYGEMPESASSVWDDILEPVIFIAAAAATVVLLFTVRSSTE